MGDRRTRNSARGFGTRAGAEMAVDHAAAEVDHLAAERAAARFDVEAMKVAWAGSRHAVDVADRMARLVASDPVSGCFLRSPPSSSLIPNPACFRIDQNSMSPPSASCCLFAASCIWLALHLPRPRFLPQLFSSA